MKIAAATYPIDWHDSWQSYVDKLSHWVETAEADLLVFPEYGGMELASFAGAAVAGDLQASIAAVSERVSEADALHAALASTHGCHILAASAPVVTADGVVNRARLFAPEGVMGYQDKQIMTRFEREIWDISSGGALQLFETALGRIAVLICYDAEFPLLAQAVIAAGAEIILVPSCTDSAHGFARVRIGAMARALEGQCITVQSPTTGNVDWSPAVDENVGAAGIFGPPDHGFPATGIMAEATLDRPGWTRAEVDLAAIHAVRRDGQVLNLAHWPEQLTRSQVQTVKIS
ncbi:carbon-nitrogen hydrolase family protein [Yoonia sediminilitoris]|uniref:Putative amidohydrolase n=1 Tax=Yoonia sediminilitoris TaxID=1286148 RepID=A0A2T6KLX5_9RHOB|nr:carbon-nitrogen hydrolase family protein [Yoonia sediminilitoris]PUB17219.1 putative amidohydrolase [Yoonia sediminilitoris]RCW97514.1 putative amidohydrolase [Yoonia sediminilitoris]